MYWWTMLLHAECNFCISIPGSYEDYVDFLNDRQVVEEFKDTKGVIRSRKSKRKRECSGQKKKEKQ
jgi:hypothetical protein